MRLLAKRVPQRTMNVFGSGDGETRPAAEACALVAAGRESAAALARLCFDIYRLFKNSAEPSLRSESAVRKAARKWGRSATARRWRGRRPSPKGMTSVGAPRAAEVTILGEAIPFRANAAEAFSGATQRATRLRAGSRVRAAGQGSPSIAPAAQALLAAQILRCGGPTEFFNSLLGSLFTCSPGRR